MKGSRPSHNCQPCSETSPTAAVLFVQKEASTKSHAGLQQNPDKRCWHTWHQALRFNGLQAYSSPEAWQAAALSDFKQTEAFGALKCWTSSMLKEGAACLNVLQSQMPNQLLASSSQASSLLSMQRAWAALGLLPFLGSPAEVLILVPHGPRHPKFLLPGMTSQVAQLSCFVKPEG